MRRSRIAVVEFRDDAASEVLHRPPYRFSVVESELANFVMNQTGIQRH